VARILKAYRDVPAAEERAVALLLVKVGRYYPASYGCS
jgi:hypothetical protein